MWPIPKQARKVAQIPVTCKVFCSTDQVYNKNTSEQVSFWCLVNLFFKTLKWLELNYNRLEIKVCAIYSWIVIVVVACIICHGMKIANLLTLSSAFEVPLLTHSTSHPPAPLLLLSLIRQWPPAASSPNLHPTLPTSAPHSFQHCFQPLRPCSGHTRSSTHVCTSSAGSFKRLCLGIYEKCMVLG